MKNIIDLTQQMLDRNYGLEIKQEFPEQYFIDRNCLFLGTRKLPDEYKDGIIPPEDEVNIYFPEDPTSNPLNMAIIEPTGTKKTRLLKNIVYGLKLLQSNVVVVQYKSRQWEYINEAGDGEFYHQYIHPRGVKRSDYIPSYIVDFEPVQDVIDEYKVYSPSIHTFKKDLDWKYLKASEVATSTLAGLVKRGVIELDKLKTQLNFEFKKKRLASSTKVSALRHLENLQNKNIFGYADIPFEVEWNEGNIITISFFGQEDNIELNVFKLVEALTKIGINERTRNQVTRKVVVFDDPQNYIRANNFYSSLAVNNIQNMSREYGMNCIAAFQDPTEVKSTILNGFTTKIIGQIDSYDTIKGLPFEAKEILKNKDLYADRDNFIFEKLLIHNGKVERFFQYDCIVKHQR